MNVRLLRFAYSWTCTLRADEIGLCARLHAGRSPGSRVTALFHLPGRNSRPVVFGTRSPLTVAGAATDLVPDGYAAPCSLLIPLPVKARETNVAPSYAREGGGVNLRWRRNPGS